MLTLLNNTKLHDKSGFAGDFQHSSNTVGCDIVRKSKKGGSVAPAVKKKATRNEEWKKICKDCEILKKGNNCYYGCEIIKAALKKEKKKKL
jgi:hypothetical protein